MTLPLQSNLKGLPLAPAQCVDDPHKEELVQQACRHAINNDCLNDSTVLPQFISTYTQWIQSTKNNSVLGLEQFSTVAFSAGTTEAFDKFYLKHHDRRFRCLRGEYIYHVLSWQQQHRPWAYLDDEPLTPGDAVVISLPFADTGNCHEFYTKQFLDQCVELDVPVLLDCAFFGICGGVEFDFDHPAIQEICFSLSKTFPVSTLRIGVRYSRHNDGDSLLIYNDTQYINRFGAAVGTVLMNLQTPDETFDRYRSQQLHWCNIHSLAPSNTVIFGVDTQHCYDNHNRGSKHTNRLCFSKYFNFGPLPL